MTAALLLAIGALCSLALAPVLLAAVVTRAIAVVWP